MARASAAAAAAAAAAALSFAASINPSAFIVTLDGFLSDPAAWSALSQVPAVPIESNPVEFNSAFDGWWRL